MICGRSGFLVLFLFLPILLYINTVNKFSFVLAISLGFCLIVVFFNAATYYIEHGNPDVTFITAYERTFESYLRYNETGELSDKGVSTLSNHFLFPDSFYTFFIGEAHYMDGATDFRLLKSDIGYIRYLWSYGLIGSILYYIPYIFIINYCYKNRQVNQLLSQTIITMCIATLFFHSKEIFVFTKIGFSILMLLFITFIIEQNKLKLKESINNE